MRPSIPIYAAALVLLLTAAAWAGPRHTAATPAQLQAFKQLQARYPAARAVWQPGLAGPQMVTGLAARPTGAHAEARARAFLKSNRPLFGVPDKQLRLLKVERSKLREVARFQQVADGLEVLGRVVALTMDHSGELLTVASDAAPVGTVQRGKMSRQEAMERAVKAVTATPAGSPPPKLATSAREVVMAGFGDARHAWAVRVVRSRGVEHLRVVVDARHGGILQIRNLVRH